MKDALKLALEAAYLAGFNASGEGYNGEYPFQDHNAHPEQDAGWVRGRDNKLSAIKQALAAPVQEPVAKYIGECPWGSLVQLYEDVKKGTDFYTTQPASQRQWVGLTDDEILKLAYPIRWQEVDDFEADKAVNFAQAIEAKLKERNK